MTSRREFIREAAGAAIGSSVVLPTFAMRKGILGAKNTSVMPTAASWDNPYVTDGLLAMYDGEWNAGPFQHNPNTMPIDLTGKGFLNLSFEGDIEMTENSVLFHGSSQAIDRTLQILAPYDAITIEYVSYLPGWKANMSNDLSCTLAVGWVWWGTGFSYSRRSAGFSTSGSGERNFSSFHLGVYDTSGKYPQGRFSYSSIADLTDGSRPTVNYINGIKQGGTARTTSNKNKNPTAAFVVRGTKESLMPNADSHMYSLRVYGRALTDDEVAENYSINKERFGI